MQRRSIEVMPMIDPVKYQDVQRGTVIFQPIYVTNQLLYPTLRSSEIDRNVDHTALHIPLSCYGKTDSLIVTMLILTAPIIHQAMVSPSDSDKCTADAHPSVFNGLHRIILDAYRGKKTAKEGFFTYTQWK